GTILANHAANVFAAIVHFGDFLEVNGDTGAASDNDVADLFEILELALGANKQFVLAFHHRPDGKVQILRAEGVYDLIQREVEGTDLLEIKVHLHLAAQAAADAYFGDTGNTLNPVLN